jgi:hypothetical protein
MPRPSTALVGDGGRAYPAASPQRSRSRLHQGAGGYFSYPIEIGPGIVPEPEGDDAKGSIIESVTQEWVEQKMVESVQGLRQLENGTTWLTQHYDDALSPVALTAAFMADRYHTLREVKRQVGNMRRPEAAAS